MTKSCTRQRKKFSKEIEPSYIQEIDNYPVRVLKDIKNLLPSKGRGEWQSFAQNYKSTN